MADRSLLIAPNLLEELRALAHAALPRECCGLLIGRSVPSPIVTRLVPAENIHDEPTRFFTLDPVRHFALLRELRAQDGEGGEVVLGHYHSHPEGPAEPSARDLADAEDSAMIWLIVAPASGDIGAFQPRADDAGKVIAFERLTILA
jgi:proteasome lid subunit RPN8/RPN11